MTLPGLPTSSDRSADIAVVTEPVREVVEIRTDDERAVYVVEPVTTVPAAPASTPAPAPAPAPVPSTAITWGDLGTTPGAPAPTDSTTGTIPSKYTVGSRLFFGDGPPTELAPTSKIATLAVVSDVYLDRRMPALWAMSAQGWQMLLDLQQDTMLYLGFGDPNVVPENYKRVHNAGIDVSTLDIYEFPQGAPEGVQEG